MADKDLTVLAQLPVHGDGRLSAWRGLRVEGLVRHPLTLSLRDLEQMAQDTLIEDFRCEEGWVVPRQRWEGPHVAGLLGMVELLPGARFIACSAADFTVALPLEEAQEGTAICALRLDGAPIAPEHGGPCRLVVPGKTCYFSIKWLDRIQVLAEQPDETGKAIALDRIRKEMVPAPRPQ